MMGQGRRTLVYFSTLAAALSASALAYAYSVKKGDTLSKIAAAQLGIPVYGKDGNLQKVLTLNPQIANPNLIFPGQPIALESKPLRPAALSKNDPLATPPGRTPASKEETTPKTNPAPDADSSGGPASSPVTIAAGEFSRFNLETVLGQTRIDATDLVTGGHSVSGSAFSPELRAAWEQHWENGAVSFLSAHVRREDFKTTSSTTSFSEHTPTEIGFEAGARLVKFGERGSLWTSLSYDGEPFVRAKSATELTVEALCIPKANLRADFELLHSKIFRLAAEVGGSYLAPTSSDGYSTKSGFGWEAAVRLTHARPNRPFFGGLRIEQQRQDTTISNQTYTAAGVFFGMSFDIGENP